MAAISCFVINLGASTHQGIPAGGSGTVTLDDTDPTIEIQDALNAGCVLMAEAQFASYADASEELKRALRNEQISRIAGAS